MGDFILNHQAAIRLGSFFLILAAMGAWEALAPRRQRRLTRLARWPHNIGIVLVNTLLVRALFPMAGVGAC